MSTRHDEWIDNVIAELEKTGVIVPPENRKNAYTKACFLLSHLQKVDQMPYFARGRNGGHNTDIQEAIKAIRESLPLIRQAVNLENVNYSARH